MGGRAYWYQGERKGAGGEGSSRRRRDGATMAVSLVTDMFETPVETCEQNHNATPWYAGRRHDWSAVLFFYMTYTTVNE